MHRKFAALLLGGSALVGATPLSAQTVAAETTAPVEAEIVVTANKREQNLNDVGLTITALSGQQLADRRITSVQDVAAAIPGLQYAQSGTNTPIFTLRGVGFNEESLGVYPAVSVYVDEVPLPFPVLTMRSAFDLQRIEALKGPQGTLFGQNSTGGAINYVAAKPTKDFEAGADISYGRFNQIEGNAFVSGPLTSTLGMRLAVTGSTMDGWQQSYTRPGDRNGAQKYFAGRLTTAWEASSSVRFLLSLNGWKDTSEPTAPQYIGVRPQQPANVQAVVLNYPFAPDDVRAADWTPGALSPRSDRRLLQASLRTDIDLSDAITLTSLTSYNDFKQDLYTDKDGMAPQVANLGPSDGKITSFNQELRLASAGKTDFRWVFGANYEDSRTFENQTLNFGNGSSSNPGTLFINTTGSEVSQKIRNYAVFGNAEYDLGSRLTVKLGGRYTNSRIRADLCGTANGDGNVADLFNILGGLLGSVPFTPIGTGDCYVLNNQGVPGDRFLSTLAEDNFSWRAGLDYRASDDLLLYANVSRGYKTGSYPTLSASTFAQYQPVSQESVTSYEAGLKATLGALQFNGAAFYYNYKDKQIRGKIVDPVFDVLDILINVPKSRVWGAEADVTVRPLQGLSLQGTVTYLNSRVTDYIGPTVYGNTANFAGDPLPFTPEWSYGINMDYRGEMTSTLTLVAGASVRGQSRTVSTLNGEDIAFPAGASNRIKPGIDRPFVLPAYATVDARLGIESGRWRATLWGKNIFNKYFFTNSNQFLDVTTRYTGLPASYGVTIGVKY